MLVILESNLGVFYWENIYFALSKSKGGSNNIVGD